MLHRPCGAHQDTWFELPDVHLNVKWHIKEYIAKHLTCYETSSQSIKIFEVLISAGFASCNGSLDFVEYTFYSCMPTVFLSEKQIIIFFVLV